MKTFVLISIFTFLMTPFTLQCANHITKFQRTTIPFELIGKLVIISAKADGLEGHFIFDSGTPDFFLNQKYFDGIPSHKVIVSVDGSESKHMMKYVHLDLNGFEKKQVYSVITDLSNHELRLGMPIIGIIGVKIFLNCEIVVDYVFKELTIYPLDPNGERKDHIGIHTNPSDTLWFRGRRSLPLVEVEVNGQKLKMGLDTGAGVNVLDSRSLSKVKLDSTTFKKEQVAVFGEKLLAVETFNVQNVKIGNNKCPDMKTISVSLRQINWELSGPRMDGIIGYEFLRNFRVSINFRKREIYLWERQKVKNQFLAMKDSLIQSSY